MEKFIHLGPVLYHLSLRFSFAHSVIYDNFSKENIRKEGKYLIIFYAVDKILLDIHNTHTNACNRSANSRQFICAISASGDEKRFPFSDENHFQMDP